MPQQPEASNNKEHKLTIGYLLDDTLDRSDGVQAAVLDIGAEMTRRGHSVHYVVGETKRSDLNNIHGLAKLAKLPFNGNSTRTPYPVSSQSIDQLFSEVEFDVLHVQMPYSPFFAARVIRRAPDQTAVFGTFHILPYSKFSGVSTKFLGRMLRSSLKRFNGAFAVSRPALDFMQSSFSISGKVLPNPIDYKFFNNYAQKLKNQPNKIVFVGRFEERKGAMNLVLAVKILVDYGADITVTMCGKGPESSAVADYVSDNKLPISLPGFVSLEQKAEELATAQIAIFPSISGESFGIVLAEAMAAGSGVTLGGDNPGYASVLADWPEALFDARSPQVIADKLKQFLKSPELVKSIGNQQHQFVKDFDVTVIADKLEAEYLSEV